MQQLKKKDNYPNAKTTNALANNIMRAFTLERVLLINASTSGVFSEVKDIAELEITYYNQERGRSDRKIIVGDPLLSLDEIDKCFDFVVGELPLALKQVEWEYESIRIKSRKNWIMIYKSLFKLAKDGLGLFLVEPAIWSREWKRFLQDISQSGFFVDAYFNAPEDILRPKTSIRPIIVLISGSPKEKLFVAELTDTDGAESLVNNFKEKETSRLLEMGIFIDEADFVGFENYKIARQIEKLQAQYKEYKKYPLVEIAVGIKQAKQNETFEELNNAIYIPKVGNSPVVYSLSNARLKHHNYFQVILDSSKITNQYAALFFSSELGQRIMASLYVGVSIRFIKKSSLEQVIIPIPGKKEQELIVSTNENLCRLESSINEFRKELSLNPKSAAAIQDKIDNMRWSLSSLSDADRIRSIIRNKESKTLEFKQTLSLDIKTRKKGKNIERSSLKTLAAFLNTEGGILLIGVDDEGDIVGLNEEISLFYKNEDKFLLHFKNLVKEKIGEQFYPFIPDYRIIDVNSKKVLFVKCEVSTIPCFYESKEFFVRTNPATDKLEGPKVYEYIKNHPHFKN